MYACAVFEQRLGSSRSIKRDPVGAGRQLQPSCRQQVATSRLSCAGHALSSSSPSYPSAAHEHGAHQQQEHHHHPHQQEHSLLQQQHQSVVQPAVVPVAQLCQHSSTDAAPAGPPTTAFYTPGGPSSSGSSSSSSSNPSAGLLGVVLPWTGLSGATAGLRPTCGSSAANAESISSSNGVGMRHSSSGSDSTSAHQPAAAVPQPPINTQQQPQRKRGAKQNQAAAAAGHSGTQAASTSSKKQRSHKARNKRGSGSSDELSASKQLTSAIAQASCWQHLQRLLQQHSVRMNHIHAAALLNTTSKLVQYHQLDPKQQQLFAGFYVDALQLAYTQAQGAARPRELSSMLWAVAKVGLHPGTEWLAAYLAEVQPQLQAMTAQDLGLLVWALARFRLQPEPGFCRDLLATTQELFQGACSSDSSRGSPGVSSKDSSSSSSSRGSSRQRVFDAQGLCNIVWGLAVLELSPGQEWLAAAAAAAEQPLRQGQFEPQGIAVTLWAMAKCGFKAQQPWLHAAADAAALQLYAFKPAELSMLCHALARLHYQPLQAQQVQQQLEADMQVQQLQGADADHPPGAEQQQRPVPLLAQVQAVSWPQLQCLRFSEAANLLWALGVMGQQLAPEWVASALQQLQATLHEADAKALASACYGLAKLRHRGADSWWDAVWLHVPHVRGFSAAAGAGAEYVGSDGASSSSGGAGDAACCPYAASQSQATFLWAAAKLGVAPPAAVADSLFAASEQLLQKQAVNGAELMALTTAAAMLRLAPPSSWLHAADSMFGTLLLHSCSFLQQQQQQAQPEAVLGQFAQQQVDVLQRLGSLLQQHSVVLEAPSQQQQQLAALAHPVLKPSEASNTVFSLARLRFVPSAAVLSTLHQYVQQHGPHFVEADWQQLGRGVQSWQDQSRRACVAAAAAVREGLSAACACSSGGSSNCSSVQAAEHQQGVADAADSLHSSGQLTAAYVEALTSEAGADGFHAQQQHRLRSVAEGVHAACFAADGDLQGEEMLVYGKYLQLPLRSSSRDNSSLCMSGFQAAAGTAADAERHVVAGAVPFKRRTAITHQQLIALAGGLSVASG